MTLESTVRRILYITGSRADYGPARSLLRALDNDPGFDLQLLVTGMHLEEAHGETWREIESDGLCIAERVGGRARGDSLSAMGSSIGAYLNLMSPAIERLRPDIVLTLGDRGEQLAGAIAAAVCNVTVAHLCGGSISGSIDDSIRHAITKFAHYHLPAFEEHALRIVQMGEPPDRVRVVGLPGADLRADARYSREDIVTRYNLPRHEPYLLVAQHSVTQSQSAAAEQITETLEAIAQSGLNALLANPNDDAGGKAILEVMKAYAGMYEKLHILPPPGSRELYASVMKHAAAQVGNSSSGIVEAMSLNLPVINIGERQRGREHLSCMLNVGHNRTEIASAIETALTDVGYRNRLKEHSEHMQSFDTNALVADLLRKCDTHVASQPKPFLDLPGAVPASILRRTRYDHQK